MAFSIAAIFSVATVWVGALQFLSGYAWILGALLGVILFWSFSPRKGKL